MTPEERIAKLEERVAQLEAQAAETGSALLYVAGAARAYEGAVLALILAAHPDVVGEGIAWHLEHLNAELVCSSLSDDQLEGSQNAGRMLVAALEASRALAGEARGMAPA